jgi:hypothetical protein
MSIANQQADRIKPSHLTEIVIKSNEPSGNNDVTEYNTQIGRLCQQLEAANRKVAHPNLQRAAHEKQTRGNFWKHTSGISSQVKRQRNTRRSWPKLENDTKLWIMTCKSTNL